MPVHPRTPNLVTQAGSFWTLVSSPRPPGPGSTQAAPRQHPGQGTGPIPTRRPARCDFHQQAAESLRVGGWDALRLQARVVRLSPAVGPGARVVGWLGGSSWVVAVGAGGHWPGPGTCLALGLSLPGPLMCKPPQAQARCDLTRTLGPIMDLEVWMGSLRGTQPDAAACQ